jgi:PIN domain nuclease of toxin-antitoxin system
LILLIDAHVLVWWLAEDQALPPEVRSAIADPANDVLVSSATVWELAIKRAKGKIRLPEDLSAAIDAAGFSSVPVTSEDAETAAELPAHHQDPFDRMLVAQTRRLGAVLVSRDAAFDAYGVDILRT